MSFCCEPYREKMLALWGYPEIQALKTGSPAQFLWNHLLALEKKEAKKTSVGGPCSPSLLQLPCVW